MHFEVELRYKDIVLLLSGCIASCAISRVHANHTQGNRSVGWELGRVQSKCRHNCMGKPVTERWTLRKQGDWEALLCLHPVFRSHRRRRDMGLSVQGTVHNLEAVSPHSCRSNLTLSNCAGRTHVMNFQVKGGNWNLTRC